MRGGGGAEGERILNRLVLSVEPDSELYLMTLRS